MSADRATSKMTYRRFTKAHLSATTLMVLLGTVSIVAAATGQWLFAVVGLVAQMLTILLVVILGFSITSQRLVAQSHKTRAHLGKNYRRTLASRSVPVRSTPALTTTTSPSEVPYSEGALEFWSEKLRSERGQLQWFIQMSMQTRLEGSREVLAYAATSNRYDFAQLGDLLESTRIPLYRANALAALESVVWKPALLGLARVLYSNRLTPVDLLDSLTLFQIAEEFYGLNNLRKGMDRSLYGDLLANQGQFDEARRVLSPVTGDEAWNYSQRVLALNALNPSVCGTAKHRSEWLDSLNELLATDDLAPIYFEDDREPTFSTIRCDAPPIVLAEMPKLSVIMPIYEPDASTDVAIASLLAQTWTNLEILIIDDASPTTDSEGRPTDYRERLEYWARRDPRITLRRFEQNRGAYAVRNEGVDMATGEFLTIADKDDWHHPQKYELQARELLENPAIPANMTNWVRVDESMRFEIRSGTGKVVYPSFASVMLRREQVLSKLGYWDTVRKGADAEFKARFATVFGYELAPSRRSPMAFSLLGDGNLTRADMGAGYLSPDRRAYSRAYRAWHARIAAGEESPYLPKHPEVRPFIAPRSFLPERAELPPAVFDVIFMSEFGFMAGNSTSLRQEIQVALDHGLRVGIIPVQNGLIASAAKRQFHPRIEELVLDGRIERLSLQDSARADLLIIRWPASLQLLPASTSDIAVDSIVVVANHMPYEVDGSRRSYEVRRVSANIQAIFGQRPLWASQSETIERHLDPLVPLQECAPFTWKGIIEPADWGTRGPVDTGRTPIIGRHGRDESGKWPSSAEDFARIYPTDGSVLVKMMGGAKTPFAQGHLPEDPGAHWEVIPFNGMPVEEYLRSIDFFVYYHSDGLVEAFGMSILEAINQGTVAILPPHFEPVFGKAAVYAKPGEVQDTIRSLWDEDAYANQRERGFDFIRRECTPEAFVLRLSRLGVARASSQGTEQTDHGVSRAQRLADRLDSDLLGPAQSTRI